VERIVGIVSREDVMRSLKRCTEVDNRL
jgi:predicted transcriptional regulator